MSGDRVALGAAVAAGYALGRTRKARLALAVGTYLAGRGLGVAPGRASADHPRGMPQLQELVDQVRGELLTAGRAAVTAVVDRRLTRAADTLRHRTDALVRGDAPGRPCGERSDERYAERYDEEFGEEYGHSASGARRGR
ncbi:hypothetical protein ACF1A5_28215 [Streptomyces sp. NPDC014864]|uniref:hypothetical protein n=1 Tax=Streptomyces sp. NPDC014864 TaxID=3364924 RepID=UPI0036F4BCFC